MHDVGASAYSPQAYTPASGQRHVSRHSTRGTISRWHDAPTPNASTRRVARPFATA